MSLGSGRRYASDQQEDTKIAKQLCYPKSVIDKLTNEPDKIKRQRILTSARNGIYK